MPRPVALLDVDHTLIFDTEDNKTLIDSLKKNGMRDVYLFTDMMYTPAGMKDRITLIDRLKAQGFTVHGVITPADLTWQAQPADQGMNFYNRIMGPEASYKGNGKGEAFENFITDVEKELPFIGGVKKYSPEQNKPGVSFVEAARSYEQIASDPELPNNMRERSFVAKMMADRYAPNNNYAHTKAFMLDLFLRNKPDWVSSVLVVDDDANVIKSVQEYKEREKPIIPITSIHITEKNWKNLSRKFYQTAITAHLNQDPLADKKVSRFQAIANAVTKSFNAAGDWLRDNFNPIIARATRESVKPVAKKPEQVSPEVVSSQVTRESVEPVAKKPERASSEVASFQEKKLDSNLLHALEHNIKKYSPNQIATQLFLIAAAHYQNYDMDNLASRGEDMKKMNELDTLLQKQVIASVVNESSPHAMQKNLIFWCETMKHSLEKGDYTTFASIRLAMEELEYKNDPKLKEAFSILPKEREDFLKDNISDRKLTYLENYGKGVSIPYVGIYSKVAAMAKEIAKNSASPKDVPKEEQAENVGITKLREFTQATKVNLNAQINKEREKLRSLVGEVSQYGKNYQNLNNSVDEKKYKASLMLNGFMQNNSLSAEEKLNSLVNFIDTVPQNLQHNSFLNKSRKSDFTLVKMAQQMLPIMQAMAAHEAIFNKNTPDKPSISVPTSEAKEEVKSDIVRPSGERNTDLPIGFRRSNRPVLESITSGLTNFSEVKKIESSAGNQNRSKPSTAEITSAFKKKLAFFASLNQGEQNLKTAKNNDEEHLTHSGPKN